MLVYIVAVYVPFTIALMRGAQDVWCISLSRIAWQRGEPVWMVLFGLLTLPFTLYLVIYYARVDRRRVKNVLVALLLFGGAALFVGMFVPDRGASLFTRLHFVVEVYSTIIVMLAVTGMVLLYCVTGDSRQRRQRSLLGAGYGIFALAAGGVYLIRGTSAMLEAGLSLGAMIALSLINRWISAALPV